MFKPEVKRTNGLNIIIAGCGKVGISLTERLAKEGHDITVIDRDSEKVQMASGLFDVMGIVGTGASFSIQMEAGIENADLFIAVTDSDELNLLCCTVAKRVGNCAAIARVRNHQVACDRRLDGDRGSLLVTDLTDHNDIRVLTQNGTQRRGESEFRLGIQIGRASCRERV